MGADMTSVLDKIFSTTPLRFDWIKWDDQFTNYILILSLCPISFASYFHEEKTNESN